MRFVIMIRDSEQLVTGEQLTVPQVATFAATEPSVLQHLTTVLTNALGSFVLLDDRIVINTQAIDTISIDG